MEMEGVILRKAKGWTVCAFGLGEIKRFLYLLDDGGMG